MPRPAKASPWMRSSWNSSRSVDYPRAVRPFTATRTPAGAAMGMIEAVIGDLLRLRGRIRRARLWLGVLMLAVLLLGAQIVAETMFGPSASASDLAGMTGGDLGVQPADGPADGIETNLMAARLVALVLTAALGAVFFAGQAGLLLVVAVGYVAFVVVAGFVGYDDLYAGLRQAAEAQGGDDVGRFIRLVPDATVLAAFVAFASAVNIAFALLAFSIGTRRCHDRGKSGWWMLLTAVPILGFFWWLIDLGLMPGERGVNKYGPDPRSFDSDA